MENPGKIKEIFESISVRNFLKSWIDVYFNDNYKMYNFTFPDWLKKKESFTLFELLIGYIEQNKPIQNKNTFVSDLISILYKNQYEFDYIKPITTASVPVIKIQFDITSLIDLNDVPNYIDEEDLNKLKFDITFKEDDVYSEYYIKTINFVQESINNYPYIKNIILFLKRYFKKINLNKSYNGGLSSYSLFLLVLAFLKNNKFSNDISIGKQLYYFIEFYSFFNFSEYMIKVSEEYPFVQIEDNFKNDKIVIIDTEVFQICSTQINYLKKKIVIK